MVKHTQTIRRQFVEEFLGVFGHFVRLALKGLIHLGPKKSNSVTSYLTDPKKMFKFADPKLFVSYKQRKVN